MKTTTTTTGALREGGAAAETRTKQATEVARVMAMTAAKVAEVNAESSSQTRLGQVPSWGLPT